MSGLYSAQRIMASCQAQARRFQVNVVARTGSTNLDLSAQIGQLEQPAVLIAEQQTAGRGRAGRSWLSSPEGSLTFSIAWRFQRTMQELSGLPLAVGVAVAEALHELSTPVQLKWPNDILKNGKKLGGILIHSEPCANAAACWAVIGIGINLTMPDALEAQIGHPVAAIPWLAQMDRNALMAALLNRLAAAATTFEEYGLAAFSDRWLQFHAYNEQIVTILDQGQVIQEGRVCGIDPAGHLLLATKTGVVTIFSGDVSLRSAEPKSCT